MLEATHIQDFHSLKRDDHKVCVTSTKLECHTDILQPAFTIHNGTWLLLLWFAKHMVHRISLVESLLVVRRLRGVEKLLNVSRRDCDR